MDEWTHAFPTDLWLREERDGSDEASFLGSVLRLTAGDHVLDAPCGSGRIALPMARSGCFVTAVDLNTAFLDRAEERFREESLEGRFLQMDLREIDFTSEFKGAFCWKGSFGYFSDRENQDLIGRYAQALVPGGRLVIDQPNREVLLRRFQPRIVAGDVTRSNTWRPETERIESDWIIETSDAPQPHRMSIRLYTPAQMKRLFASVGFTVESMFGSIRGERYRRSARRLITVGVKDHYGGKMDLGS